MMEMQKFAERLNEYMFSHSLNATQLAEKTGIARSTICGLLRKEHLPSTTALVAFVEYFHCPADYLLGLIDDFVEPVKFSTPSNTFAERLRCLLVETNTTQYFLTKHHKISGNLLYKWLNDQAIPSVYNLIKLAKALNVSVDCLLGRE